MFASAWPIDAGHSLRFLQLPCEKRGSEYNVVLYHEYKLFLHSISCMNCNQARTFCTLLHHGYIPITVPHSVRLCAGNIQVPCSNLAGKNVCHHVYKSVFSAPNCSNP